MIFVVDENNCVGVGETVVDAYKDYAEACNEYPQDTLRVFEGSEVIVQYVLTPKAKKAK